MFGDSWCFNSIENYRTEIVTLAYSLSLQSHLTNVKRYTKVKIKEKWIQYETHLTFNF